MSPGKIELTGVFVCPKCGTRNPYAFSHELERTQGHTVECVEHLTGCGRTYQFLISTKGNVARVTL